MFGRMSALVICFATFSVSAQTCLTNAERTTPTADFTDHNDGTVTHEKTGLTWRRCPVGQTYNMSSGACDGSLSGFTWNNALAEAESSSFSGSSDWRLPNPKELASLIEFACDSPTANTEIFPYAGGSYFWTSSPFAGMAQDRAWALQFDTSPTQARDKNSLYPIYLVR